MRRNLLGRKKKCARNVTIKTSATGATSSLVIIQNSSKSMEIWPKPLGNGVWTATEVQKISVDYAIRQVLLHQAVISTFL